VAYTVPNAAAFKSRFDRDFPFPLDQSDVRGVRDLDISRALTQASFNFNEGLFASQAIFTEAYLLLTAHYLCTNLLASSQGLGGAGQWLTQSKTVGSVSESYSVPPSVANDPFLGLLSKTTYGALYLQLIAPLLVGNIICIAGRSTPD
jgi:hypothetical protein